MSRISNTTKRLARIDKQHFRASRMKPEVASVGNGKAQKGFDKVVKGKSTRVSGPMMPNVKFN